MPAGELRLCILGNIRSQQKLWESIHDALQIQYSKNIKISAHLKHP